MDESLAALDAWQLDPYPHYRRARETPGLTFVPELDAWLVARDEDVREVLRRPREFSSANSLRPDVMPGPGALGVLTTGFGGYPSVVAVDGDPHRRLRAPVNRGLTPARVEAVVPYIGARVAELVDGFAGDGRVELVGACARLLPGRVVGHLLGLHPADVPTAVHGSYRAEALLFRPMSPEEQIGAAEDVVAMQHLLDSYARARRRHPRDDMIGEMVSGLAPGTGELTPEQRNEIVSQLQNLLIAGHLTTSALIGTTVLQLLRHDQWHLLCERPELIPAAIEEAARYDSVVQGFRRLTTGPVTLAGTELPAGAAVFAAFGSANRDEEAVDRPEVFDITREPGRRLAFGHGPHGCPGHQLAREQLRLTLEALCARFPGLRLAPGHEVRMLPTLIHRSPAELNLVW
ncbi:Cytochrome P450 107B1 [Streptomyces sp. RB5]|uniref:Cytochrome P450 107B1 n=1 Tax=Streptomyces smaragdinus TaxID=2585196 RepID=A0A7K0C9J7_9ACTN|nr:cytochrome P450 [Streptomyces smaragdinus]MQY10127.1 Cytochrome P450 107B1 [Streptomyces smaragdinus]